MVGVEYVQTPGAAAIGYRVDEDQRVPVVKQVVGQVHAPDAVVDGPDVRIILPDWDVPDYLGAEPVVAEEDVADAGHQDAHWNRMVRRRYMCRILRYRRASGRDISPITTPAIANNASRPTNTHPTIAMLNSFQWWWFRAARLRRGTSTGSGHTTRAGRPPDRPRRRRRRAGCRQRLRALW